MSLIIFVALTSDDIYDFFNNVIEVSNYYLKLPSTHDVPSVVVSFCKLSLQLGVWEFMHTETDLFVSALCLGSGGLIELEHLYNFKYRPLAVNCH